MVGDLEPEMVYHIMLKVDDKYYDERGEWSKDEIIETYQRINMLVIIMGEHEEIEKYDIIKINEDDIEKLTEPNMILDELISKLEFTSY